MKYTTFAEVLKLLDAEQAELIDNFESIFSLRLLVKDNNKRIKKDF